MPIKKPRVFLTRELPAEVMKRLEAETVLSVNGENRSLTREEIMEGVKDRDALLCLLTDPIESEIMDASPDLKVIANYAVGFNNIDVPAATKRGIPVTNTPGVLTETSADLAFSLLMASARRLVEADGFVRSGKWEGWEPLQFLGTDIHGAVLGVIGLGRIGKAVARRARGFDMNVIYWNRTRLAEEEEQELGVKYRPFGEVVQQADFLSLHVAYQPETHHLIGRKELRSMKADAVLINTARGAVVDEKALVEALRNGEIRGAGLDVFENEPQIEPELLQLKNTVILPHIGSATIATRTRMGMIAVDNILAACRGEEIPNLVNRELRA